MAGMPAGWFHGQLPEITRIQSAASAVLSKVAELLEELTGGKCDGFVEWAQATVSPEVHPCQRIVLEEDIDRVVNFFSD